MNQLTGIRNVASAMEGLYAMQHIANKWCKRDINHALPLGADRFCLTQCVKIVGRHFATVMTKHRLLSRI